MAKQVSLGGEAVPILPSVVAYKIASDTLKPFLDTMDTDTTEKFLIGLQVEFGGKPKPVISQVFFNKNSSNESYFEKGSMSLELKVLGYARPVIEKDKGTPDERSELDLSAVFPPAAEHLQAHKKLDYYKEIDFVFFPVSSLRALTLFYKELIVSGFRFDPGRKLYHGAGASVPDKKYEQVCFSLKIEGSDPDPDVWAPPASQSLNKTGDPSVGTDVLFGHPCPPMWQQFNAVAAAIVSKYGTDFLRKNINAIRAGWLNREVWNVAAPANDHMNI